MYFLRWIAGYPILIILLVTALYALYNKDSLSHWFSGGEVAGEVSHQEAAGSVATNQVAGHDKELIPGTENAAAETTTSSNTADHAATDKSVSWLDRFTHKNPAAESTNEHDTASAADMTHQPTRAEAVEIDRSGSWLDRFKRKNEVAATQETTPQHADTEAVEAENAVTEQLAEVKEESSSWLDAFKRDKPVMQEAETVTTTAAVVEENTQLAEEESGSWLDMFKRDKAEPSIDAAVVAAPAVPAMSDSTAEANVIAAVEVDKSEAAKDSSGSWLDMFKANKAEPKAAEGVVTTAEPAAAEEAADANVVVETEKKSGSWLDAFKRKADDSATEVLTETVTETTEVVTEVTSDAATSVVDAVETAEVTVTEAVKKGTGSWLDVFKPEKTAPEEAETAAETVAAAEAGAEADAEKESGSWLDIFKRKSTSAEAVADQAQADEAALAASQEASTDNTLPPSAAVQNDYEQRRNESLRLARAAYWNRDYDAAAAIYQNMTQAEPENMELLGEYGNFMLQAGRMSAALDIYEAIANVLIKENRPMEVQPLLNFIGNQDPRRADALARKLHNTQQSNK